MICREIYRMCFCFNLQGAKDWNCEYCIVCTNVLSPDLDIMYLLPLWTANLGQPEIPNPRGTIRILWWAPCLCTSLPDPSKNLSVAKEFGWIFWLSILWSLAWLLNGSRDAFCYFQLSNKSCLVSEEKPFLQVVFIVCVGELCLTPFGVYATAILISCNIIIYKLKGKSMFCIILP